MIHVLTRIRNPSHFCGRRYSSILRLRPRVHILDRRRNLEQPAGEQARAMLRKRLRLTTCGSNRSVRGECNERGVDAVRRSSVDLTSSNRERVSAKTEIPISLVKVIPERTYRLHFSHCLRRCVKGDRTEGPTSTRATQTRSARPRSLAG